ncbi:class I SAM-dependent methyltransferase [Nocardioides cynanchi]|uniref:methyltransferase domain-containing protein n=1 Tax=Nocardioides cynanchi TaxID=2558918 RepID=UPI001EE1D14A|nr:class I SAM-dependent methyltransferase [Nocardioides cynanchi]
MTVMPETSAAHVFASALRGHACTVWEADRAPRSLPVEAWRRAADADDHALLEHCTGATLDIGCGPGRLTEALARRGEAVLGIDVVGEAVRQSRDRGAPALVRDVFCPLPGEGRWETALLADGNIGIGGDPVALLTRAAELIAPQGRVVVDVAPHGTGVRTRQVRLETVHGRSRSFPWTMVGADAIEAVAAAAGLRRTTPHRSGGRCFAVLTRGR